MEDTECPQPGGGNEIAGVRCKKSVYVKGHIYENGQFKNTGLHLPSKDRVKCIFFKNRS